MHGVTRGLGMLLLAGCWTGGSTATSSPAERAPGASGSAPAPTRRPATEHAPCAIAVAPPVGATGLGTVSIELPAGETLTHIMILSQGDSGLTASRLQMGNALDGNVTIDPGLYVLEVGTAKGQRVKCTDVPVAAGGVTTVTVELPRE